MAEIPATGGAANMEDGVQQVFASHQQHHAADTEKGQGHSGGESGMKDQAAERHANDDAEGDVRCGGVGRRMPHYGNGGEFYRHLVQSMSVVEGRFFDEVHLEHVGDGLELPRVRLGGFHQDDCDMNEDEDSDQDRVADDRNASEGKKQLERMGSGGGDSQENKSGRGHHATNDGAVHSEKSSADDGRSGAAPQERGAAPRSDRNESGRASGGSKLTALPNAMHSTISCAELPRFVLSVHTDIGGRRWQEDRFTVATELIKYRNDCMFLGVFDGTVGDFASDNVQYLVIPALCKSAAWSRIRRILHRADSRHQRAVSAAEQQNNSPANAQLGGSQTQKTTLGGSAGSHDSASEDCAMDTGGASTSGITASSRQDGEVPVGGVENNSEPTTALDAGVNEESNKRHRKSGGGDEMNSVDDVDDNLDGSDDTEKKKKQREVVGANLTDDEGASVARLMMEATATMYLQADSKLIGLCANEGRHFASSTSVTALVVAGYCCIGHLGDSRAALAFVDPEINQIRGEFLTKDHKPNAMVEHQRIAFCGGSVEYLPNHENRPFIRGGDFSERKATGEQVMQLQYSRAFGGKDLKNFGLSNEPDLRCFKIIPDVHRFMILASDGLWDVFSAQAAVNVATDALMRGHDPARVLIEVAMATQAKRHAACDNITAIVASFR